MDTIITRFQRTLKELCAQGKQKIAMYEASQFLAQYETTAGQPTWITEELNKELIALQNRSANLERHHNQGVIDYSKYTEETNKINHAFQYWINDLKMLSSIDIIVPPFWKKWFLITCLMAMVGGGVGSAVYYFNLQKKTIESSIKTKDKDKDKVATDSKLTDLSRTQKSGSRTPKNNHVKAVKTPSSNKTPVFKADSTKQKTEKPEMNFDSTRNKTVPKPSKDSTPQKATNSVPNESVLNSKVNA
jgi:hypothetical protein